MWTYSVSHCTLTGPSGNVVDNKCYAGFRIGRNNGQYQSVANTGPIPEGDYMIGPLIPQHPWLGVNVLKLTELPTNHMHGRSGFFMHGDNPAHVGESSDGCIVTQEATRPAVGASPDKLLRVVA